ncbi:MAG: right-handed parallel beta-helix repeat-containing protein, partial [Pirellulales bacterium]|nr:right-handed parallel beta-helix repeat-containing protein [Pirellulales bacterium]
TNFGATAAVPNAGSGVLITGGATFNEITPTMRTERTYFGDEYQTWRELVVQDLISGNLGAGVTIEGAGTNDNSVLGALIGVGYNAGNMIGLGNHGPGILIRDGAAANTVDEVPLALIHEPASNVPGTVEVVFRKNVIVANGTSAAPRAGVEITGAGTNYNTVANSFIGTNPDDANQTTLGNTGDGVLISGANTVISGNVIDRNAQNGVKVVKGTGGLQKNLLLGNQIESNGGHGVLIADGAEGNGVGVHLQPSSVNPSYPIAASPNDGNTIQGNAGYQVYITQVNDDHTAYNIVAGYNQIQSPAGQDAICINGAEGNLIGNGGEGVDPTAANYVVGNGNVIDYNTGRGVVVYGADGAEGNAILGNTFIGSDLLRAIVLNGYTTIFAPSITNVSMSTGGGQTTVTFDYAVPTSEHVRLDFYYVAPVAGGNQAVQRYVGSVGDYVGSGSEQFTWTVPSDLGSVSGGYLAATATYHLLNTVDGTLTAGSITSQFALTPIP